MKAAVYYNNNDVRLEERPRPTIDKGEILVKVVASGICGSDVLEWYRIKKAPIVLGHEISGIVEEIGEGVEDLNVGDRVFVSHHVPCNRCRYCLAGNHTVCDTLHHTNFDPGGFAEFIRIPSINVESGTFVLPCSVSFDEGTFVEPLGCVLRGQRSIDLKPEHSLLILGSGISGLLHILAARAIGVEQIIATDVNRFQLEMAASLGAHAVIDAREDVPSVLREKNNGRGADRVIVCTGAFPAFQQAMRSVDRAGTVLCFATTAPGTDLPVPINEFWRNSITVTSSYAAAPIDLAEALDYLGKKKINVNPLITHRFGLADTEKGFRLMAGTSNSLKIIIEPQN